MNAMRQKKLLPLLLMSIFLFTSCNYGQRLELKGTDAPNEKIDILNSNNPFSSLGISHNSIVDVVMDKVTSLRANIKSEEQLNGIIKSEVYTQIYDVDLQDQFPTQRKLSEDEFNMFYDNVIRPEVSKKSEDITFTDGEFTKLFNAQQKIILSELEFVSKDSDMDINSILDRISKLENKARLMLSGDDLEVILCVTSIASNSMAHWYSEYSNNTKLRAPVNWKKVGVADIAGAASGAAAAGVARFFGPIGWKAWAVSILGGAAGASVYSGVEQALS